MYRWCSKRYISSLEIGFFKNICPTWGLNYRPSKHQLTKGFNLFSLLPKGTFVMITNFLYTAQHKLSIFYTVFFLVDVWRHLPAELTQSVRTSEEEPLRYRTSGLAVITADAFLYIHIFYAITANAIYAATTTILGTLTIRPHGKLALGFHTFKINNTCSILELSFKF